MYAALLNSLLIQLYNCPGTSAKHCTDPPASVNKQSTCGYSGRSGIAFLLWLSSWMPPHRCLGSLARTACAKRAELVRNCGLAELRVPCIDTDAFGRDYPQGIVVPAEPTHILRIWLECSWPSGPKYLHSGLVMLSSTAKITRVRRAIG